MCVGVVGEVWRSVHVHVFKCVWVHMHANLNLKTENFQITCNLFKETIVIVRHFIIIIITLCKVIQVLDECTLCVHSP